MSKVEGKALAKENDSLKHGIHFQSIQCLTRWRLQWKWVWMWSVSISPQALDCGRCHAPSPTLHPHWSSRVLGADSMCKLHS